MNRISAYWQFVCALSATNLKTVLAQRANFAFQAGLMLVNNLSFFTRFVAGKMADKKGRVWVFQIAMAVLVVAMLLIATASSPWLLALGAVVYGLASGLLSPASSAWTADLSHPEHRGRAMATMYISLEVGIGLGAALSGWIFSDQLARIPWLFGAAALAGLAGFIYLLLYERSARVSPEARAEVSA